MSPSPSLKPPLLSASWSPPLPCGIIGGAGGGASIGGGGGGGGGAGWMTVTLMFSLTEPAAFAAVSVIVFVSVEPGACGVPEITAMPPGRTLNCRPAGSAPDSVMVAPRKPATATDVLVNTPAVTLTDGWLPNWGTSMTVSASSWAVWPPLSRTVMVRL